MGGSNKFTNNCAAQNGSTCNTPGVYGMQGTPTAANIPGGRSAPIVWVDADDNAWLIGGEGFGATNHFAPFMNDVWEFNPASNEWTWISGPSSVSGNGESGVYPMLGTGSVGNIPGGRASGIGWMGSGGSFWLMGGASLDAKGNFGYLNDVWKYEAVAAAAPTEGFTLSASPGALSVNAGASGISTLTVTPQNGFNSAVSSTCSGLPAGATCSFSPTTVTPSGSAASAALTITTPAQARLERRNSPWVPGSTLALAACLMLWRRGKNWSVCALVVAVMLGAGALSGCGGSLRTISNPGPTHPGPSGPGTSSPGASSSQSSTVTVTATSGSMQQTATISLTVN